MGNVKTDLSGYNIKPLEWEKSDFCNALFSAICPISFAIFWDDVDDCTLAVRYIDKEENFISEVETFDALSLDEAKRMGEKIYHDLAMNFLERVE